MNKKTAVMFFGMTMASQVWAAGEHISIASSIPYLDESLVQENIVKECASLGASLSNSLSTELSNVGYFVDKVDKLDTSKDLVLEVKITSMTAGGSFVFGKQTGGTAKATLFKDGTVVKTKVFNRTSGGGVFGVYKGNCSILERITTVFGKDIALWLNQSN
ncbi:hypothetical protein [Hydromonas duriensis]|uniref:DUF4410 domain-containing protein n=1 Tax=Hydromonas duriensis TaxID=1527608 RepID=A0A4R6Y762_9BURK|nr:hypothetical protein [Hydromonas duriensis]TDR31083.1 hypothetical protein DFR44_11336 [Hydromonas duriensis]